MKIINDYPMSRVTTLGIGGPAKEFVIVKTEGEFIEVIDYAKSHAKDFLIIGGGSNLLVSDEGVNKLVIKNEIVGIDVSRDDSEVVIKSGTPLQKLVDFTISNGLSGLQNLTGIPGTVGGAVYGAAGAYGSEIIDHLVSVKVLDPSIVPSSTVIPSAARNLKIISKDQCRFRYRDSCFKRNGLIILEVTFQLERDNPEELKKEANEILNKRLQKYPKGIKCPGSFFKNIVASTLPEAILNKIPKEKIVYGKIPAGALLEEVGAKGDSFGDIEIAPYHANLFINMGNGKAKDFYNLAKKYWKKVYKKYEIKLEPEVQMINLPAF